MRVVFLPKSIEEQFPKKVRQNYDRGMMTRILAPAAAGNTLNVAICQDGRGWDDRNYNSNVAKHLRDLCDLCGLHTAIIIKDFSFMLDVDEMMTVLAQCDLFYMAGIFTVPDAWVARAHGPAFRLVEEIQTRVQYNAMAFVGVCGGALMSGSQPYRGLPPLDLLQGATVWYESCCSKAPVHTTHNIVQFTTDCAVAIYTWHDHRESASLS